MAIAEPPPPRSNPRGEVLALPPLSHPQRDKTERSGDGRGGHLLLGLSSIIAVTGLFREGRVCQPRSISRKAMPRSPEYGRSAACVWG